uniref:Programmed cell death 7 n=1 Tax=Latimeria chalumnae TaxID=7897 RepID=H3BBY2_LATCH
MSTQEELDLELPLKTKEPVAHNYPENIADSKSSRLNEDLIQKQEDQTWLTRLVSKRKTTVGRKETESLPPIGEARQLVYGTLRLVSELTILCRDLKQNVENEAVWLEAYLKATEIKKKLQEKMKTLNNPSYIESVKRRLQVIKNKRLRLRKKKQELIVEKQEEAARAAEREAKIDQWRTKCVLEVEEKNRERELKAAADSVLSEVRKKQADAKRMVDILRALEKLRKLRKEAAARKGIHPPPSADKSFDQHLERLRKLIRKRTDLYEAEERALRVMLEGEQEEERKREEEKKQKKEREKFLQKKREIESILFGEPDEIPANHPLQPFRQYYVQAERSLPALIQIRREWDQYLVPADHPNGRSICHGWIIPSPPSSDIWATALT